MSEKKHIVREKPPKTFRKKKKGVQDLIIQSLIMLESFGIPMEKKSTRLQEKIALAFLSLGDMKAGKTWNKVRDINNIQRSTREIINHQNKTYGEKRSSGSYDDVRREDMIEMTLADIILRSKPQAATNDPTRKYGLSPEYAKVIRTFGTSKWNNNLDSIIKKKGTLAKKLAGSRKIKKIPVNISATEKVALSQGKHNVLQKKIIEEFLPRFCKNGQLLYLGDTAKKELIKNEKKLKSLNFFELKRDILPDIVAYSEEKNWLYLIEAVYTAHPMSKTRKLELERMTKNCKAQIIYVSTFLNQANFRKFLTDLAWETEVWLADDPDHMIHFNGDKFLGPY